MSEAAQKILLRLDEFLAWEKIQEQKYEFYDGEAFAMVGGTWAHSVIGGNVFVALRGLLHPRGCKVAMGNMKVLVGERSFYPDVVAVCGESVDLSESTVRHPTLLVEVLSDSTEIFDKGKKWENYQRIPSLQAYVMVSQSHISVECYERSRSGWHYTHWTRRSDLLVIKSVDLLIPLTAIYEGIDVPEPEE